MRGRVVNLNRRGFLGAMLAAGIAPLIVKAGVLMPVKKIVVPRDYDALIDLLESRIRNAEATMRAAIESDLYGSGTNTLPGLAQLVAETPSSGEIFAIERAQFHFYPRSVPLVFDHV